MALAAHIIPRTDLDIAVPSRSPPLQSLVTFQNSQGEHARGTLLRVEGTTAVFEVYNPYSIVQMSEVLESLTIRAGDRIVYTGRATVNNLVNTGLLLIVSAVLLEPWIEAESYVETDQEFHRATEDFVARWEESAKLLDGYRIAVGDLRTFFVEMNQWLEHIRLNTEELEVSWLTDCHQLLERAEPLYVKLNELHRRFEQEAEKIPADLVGVHKLFFQRELHPLVMRAPFLHRTYTKPLGYAGDYEMMNMIHRETTDGLTAYAKIINTAYVRLPIAVCVINRAAMLESYLAHLASASEKDGELRVLCVGCGPAVEIERFVSSNPRAELAEFYLLDFNKETLDYAESRIKAAGERTGRKVEVHFLHKSVHSLLKGAASPLNEEFSSRFHFVYCAGLFDYLSDKVCARLVRLFYTWVVPGGCVLVTNMHLMRSSRYVLEHLADWYLIYRDEDAISQLAPGLGRQRVFTDDTGINVCLEVVRVDITASE